MTPRDRHIIEAAQLHRGLSAKEAGALLFSSEKRARRRLLLLHRAGWLERDQRPLESGIGRAPYRYTPSSAGRRVLAERRECALSTIRPVRDLVLAPHAGAVRDVVLEFHVSARKAGLGCCSISEWKPFADTPSLEDEVSAAERLRPDAAICLSSSSRAALFFLELDRAHQPLACGSPSERSIREKIDLYARYWDLDLFARWRAHFGHDFSGFRVLYATTTEERAQAIASLARSREADFVWATTSDDIHDASALSPVWFAADQPEGRHALIGGRS